MHLLTFVCVFVLLLMRSAARAAGGVELSQILAELRDPLVPVRAHALDLLRKVCVVWLYSID